MPQWLEKWGSALSYVAVSLLSAVITMTVRISTLVYRLGSVESIADENKKVLEGLKEKFEDHEKEDQKQFRELHKTIEDMKEPLARVDEATELIKTIVVQDRASVHERIKVHDENNRLQLEVFKKELELQAAETVVKAVASIHTEIDRTSREHHENR